MNTETGPTATGHRTLVVHPDGIYREVQVPDDDTAALQALYELIGCTAVDLVNLMDNTDMWVDDQGMIVDLPINGPASYMARRLGAARQPYYGVAVFSGGADEAGGLLGLDDAQHARLLALLDAFADELIEASEQ